MPTADDVERPVGSVRPGRETADLVCGRFTSSQRREAIGERFEVAVPETYRERYNLAPQQRTLIIRKRDDVPEAVMAKWGLLPHWAKDAKIAFKMINARAETLTEKPAYRGLLTRHRCLIPADGFYEWTLGSDGNEAEGIWLDPTISKEHVLSLLEPYPAELMVALPASTRVNSVRNDDSGLLLPDDALAA